MRIVDGLVNLVSGLGTARDKAGHAQYTLPELDTHQIWTAYRASSLVQRAVDMPAEDSCREWREWQAEATDISRIEAEEDRLGIREKVFWARWQARLFGGAALLIGDGSEDTSEPLDLEGVGIGGLKYITPLTRMDISAGEIELSPVSPRYRQPKYWDATTGDGRLLRIDPSRLAVFYGLRPEVGESFTTSGWGDPVLTGMLDALKRVDEAAGNAVSLTYEAKVDVLKINGFLANLNTRGEAYAQEVIKRATLAATAKGNCGMFLMDKEAEEYEQKTASFGGLPEIIDRMMQIASAYAGIPMTRLFGMSPGGMNATGESDIMGYYDRVKIEQTLHMGPAMRMMDECLIRSAVGSRPDDVHYNWRPLWQPSAKERAENADLLMSAIEKLERVGGTPPEAVSRAAVNALTESGAFPGLESYVDEAGGFVEEDPDDEAEAMAATQMEADE